MNDLLRALRWNLRILQADALHLAKRLGRARRAFVPLALLLLTVWLRRRRRAPRALPTPRLPETLTRSLRSFDAVVVLGPASGAGGDSTYERWLQAMTDVPFTAVLAEGWCPEFEDYFPHSVGKNFGGYATILSKPRVDKPPGSSRPVLRPFLVFLRDLFQSKEYGLEIIVSESALGSSTEQCFQSRPGRKQRKEKKVEEKVEETPAEEEGGDEARGSELRSVKKLPATGYR
ncbi:hypothetical protein AK812_SmicGene21199 [Symbiodinium microadriaticum]|uniref:Uncharacterized protein n=1 Tax=Symbiodinium microadriaticum TaxID=2951 RepID=A0A1Q9DN18_SYMMI|nr:hypothetical protein AK812_SmicGene21199 [Symbiodinium microadriaticum]